MMNTATDPWFQTLFADRIGGANYGKGSEIYKFEKIKRAKRAAQTQPFPRRGVDDLQMLHRAAILQPLAEAAASAPGASCSLGLALFGETFS